MDKEVINTAETTIQNNGIGFFGLLQVALILLKLTGHITISWLWVFAPTIVSIGITLLIIFAVILFIVLYIIFDIIFGR